jgi:hypothetical protein
MSAGRGRRVRCLAAPARQPRATLTVYAHLFDSAANIGGVGGAGLRTSSATSSALRAESAHPSGDRFVFSAALERAIGLATSGSPGVASAGQLLRHEAVGKCGKSESLIRLVGSAEPFCRRRPPVSGGVGYPVVVNLEQIVGCCH